MLATRRHRRLLHRPDPRDAKARPGWVDLRGPGLAVGAPPQVVLAAQHAADTLHSAQQTESDDLRVLLAQHLRVDRDRVVLGAGTDLLLRDLLDVVCDPDAPGVRRGNEVVFATPAAYGYLRAIEAVHATPVPVPLTQWRQDLAALAAAIDRDRCRAVLVSNPHYPTGGLVLGGELEDFLDRVPAEVLVVLDETRRDYALHPRTPIDLPDGLHLDAGHPEREGYRPNVAVLRGWDAYGLAGEPIGYLAADLDVAAMVAKTTVAPAPGRVAQAAAAVTLDEAVQNQYQAIWEGVACARSRLCGELRYLGFDVPDSSANYLWMRLGALAGDFARHCAQHRIHVCVYPGQGVLVTVGLPEDNDAFLAAAASYRAPDAWTPNGHQPGSTARRDAAPDGEQDGAENGVEVSATSGADVGARAIASSTGLGLGMAGGA